MNESTSSADRLIEIFNEAQRFPAGEQRRQFLAEACGDDEKLRAEVSNLLQANSSAGDFLEPETFATGLQTEGPGDTVGRYKLLERIGEGGFGIVYMAEQQQPVRRKVALKILKPGMDSRQVLARFEAERQALAIMDHPNIATVFDGGATASGRPYFVMELVKGVPVTEFCDQHQFTLRARLELFAQVCHAVQHAHQKGIIHRDIKPSNVLVAMHDATPAVKVIDFGVAKALGQELTEKTLFTGFAQLIGTPLYMSPEQAGQSAIDVDTRSDIYSLGVLLYELLTGTTPFDRQRFTKAAQDEIRRIVREEEPPKPSTRLSESKDSLPSISAHRHTEPAKLTKLVRGELDWIVMKALEKDRARRYETANSFAMDVQRYLADEPVVACPPTTAYRLKKFARRNKGGLAIAALVLFFLVLLGSGIGWAVRDRTARQAKVSGQVELILAEVYRLEQEQKWEEALLAARRAEAAATSGEANTEIAGRVRAFLKDLEFIDRLERIRMQQATWLEGKFDIAGADRDYALAFREYGVDVETLEVETSVARLKAHPGFAIPLAAAIDEWADARWISKMDSASTKELVAVARGIDPEPLRDRLRSTWGKPESEVGDELHRLAGSIDIRAQHPATLDSLAGNLQRVNRPDAAVRLLRDAQTAYPGDFWLNFNLAQQLENQNDFEGAIRFYTAAVSIRPQAVAALNNLGGALKDQNKLDEALVAYRKSIELDPKFAVAYNNLGTTLAEQGKLDEAIAAICKAIELDPKDAAAYNNLGITLAEQGKPDEAIAAYRKAIELDPKDTAAYNNLGNALKIQGKVDEALAAHRKAIELDPKDAGAYINLGNALKVQKKLDEAIAAYRKAIELDPKQRAAYNNLGIALKGQGKLDEAIAAHHKAIELDPKYALAYHNLGHALEKQKKLDKAIAAYRKAIESDPKYTGAYNNLGIALKKQGKIDEAIEAFRKAIELDPKDANTHSNLGALLCDGLRDYEGAAACFRKAIELDPKLVPAHSNLGRALRHHGKLSEAIAAGKQAIALDPKSGAGHNGLAWQLATCSDAKLRDPALAVAHATKAVELDPENPIYPNTLGVACYRIGDCKAAIAALEKSIELRKGGDSNDWFFLAMAHWRLGNKDEARQWYDRAVEWMEKNAPANQELIRFRTEAADQLDLDGRRSPPPARRPDE